MWNYEKRLQYPVKITQTNPKMAQVIISQFGGPDGELAASMRYLSQRYTMPYKEVTGILTDIGTEESAHQDGSKKDQREIRGKTSMEKEECRWPRAFFSVFVKSILSITFFKAVFLSAASKVSHAFRSS